MARDGITRVCDVGRAVEAIKAAHCLNVVYLAPALLCQPPGTPPARW